MRGGIERLSFSMSVKPYFDRTVGISVSRNVGLNILSVVMFGR